MFQVTLGQSFWCERKPLTKWLRVTYSFERVLGGVGWGAAEMGDPPSAASFAKLLGQPRLGQARARAWISTRSSTHVQMFTAFSRLPGTPQGAGHSWKQHSLWNVVHFLVFLFARAVSKV